MSEGVRRAATWALSEMEAAVDWVRRHARRAAGRGPYRVALYAGHGTAETLYVRGRVLQGEPIPPASEHEGAMAS